MNREVSVPFASSGRGREGKGHGGGDGGEGEGNWMVCFGARMSLFIYKPVTI